MKGGRSPKIVVDNYMYGMHRKDGIKTRWRCVQCNKKCNAILYTYGSVVDVIREHNHAPISDPNIVKKMVPRQFQLRRISSFN